MSVPLAGYALGDWPTVRANPKASLGNIVVADYMVTANLQENVDFKKRWGKKYQGQAWSEPDPLSYRAYLATAFAFEGIKKAKSLKVTELMPVLEGMHYRGPMGDIYLRACDHQAQIPFVAAKIASVTYPYYGVPTIIPASEASIKENDTGNPRCSTK